MNEGWYKIGRPLVMSSRQFYFYLFFFAIPNGLSGQIRFAETFSFQDFYIFGWFFLFILSDIYLIDIHKTTLILFCILICGFVVYSQTVRRRSCRYRNTCLFKQWANELNIFAYCEKLNQNILAVQSDVHSRGRCVHLRECIYICIGW